MLNTAYQTTDGASKTKKQYTAKTSGNLVADIGKAATQNTKTGGILTNAANIVNNAVQAVQQAKESQVAGATKRGGGGGGSSSGGGSGAAVSFQSSIPAYSDPEYTAPTYQQSQAVIDAYNKLQALKEPTYQNQFEGQLNSMYEQILNRPGFKYNVNEDALYQQYKDQYMQAGQTAMKDTIAQAAALTGGYGNSYAQTAGQQAYQNYLTQLNNIVPTLYNQAYSRYQDEGDAMRNNYDMIMDRYQDVYGKYRDDVSDYQSNRNFLQSAYENERNFDWDKFTSDRDFGYNQFINDRNYKRSKYESDRDYELALQKYLMGL